MLVRSLRMLLSSTGMLLALGMVALAVVFRGRAMSLRSVFVMFGSFVVFVFSHFVYASLVVRSPTSNSLAQI